MWDKVSKEQVYLYYHGKLVHRFKQGYQPTVEECLDTVVSKGYYCCEVYGSRYAINHYKDNGVETKYQNGNYFYPRFD